MLGEDEEEISSQKHKSEVEHGNKNFDKQHENAGNDMEKIHKPMTFYNKEKSAKIKQAKASKKTKSPTSETFDNQIHPIASEKDKKKKPKKQKQSVIENEPSVAEKTDVNILTETLKNEDKKCDRCSWISESSVQEIMTESKIKKECEYDVEKIMKETDLEVLIQAAKDLDSEMQCTAVEQAGKLLEKKNVDKFVEAGFLPVFVECLKSPNSKIQIESVKALTFITSRSFMDTKSVVNLNAIPSLINLMKSENGVVKESALHCLKNIICDKCEFRDKCFKSGFLPPFIKIADEEDDLADVIAAIICYIFRFKSEPVSLEIIYKLLPVLDKLYQSNDLDVLENAFQAVYLLSRLAEDIIPLIVEHEFIEKIIAFLDHSNLKIVHSALITLESITEESEEQTKAVVDAGVIPILLKLLDSFDDTIELLSLLILGNIVSDNAGYREKCLQLELIPKIITLISKESTFVQLRQYLLFISKLCKINPIKKEIVVGFLPSLKKLMHHKNVKIIQVVTFVFWGIVVKKDSQNNQLLVKNDIFKDIIPLLHYSDEKIQHYVSRTILNTVFGSPDQVQHVLDCGVMNYMEKLLTHKNYEIQALFFLRKIIRWPYRHLQIFIDANLFPFIVPLLKHESQSIQKDAVWVISNVAVEAKPYHMEYLLCHEFITSFCSYLNSPEIYIVKLVLKGINAILWKAKQENAKICEEITKSGALEKIKEYKANSTDPDILTTAREILRNNFCAPGQKPRKINNFMPHFFAQ
uniref:Uncharacterized protein n=1 Tax=Panagrolaimus sp. ES5 TaxID=591445 RepID=A0AC34FJT8_9BILA